MFKTKIDEAAYVGNIGAMEMFRFHQTANADQKKKLQQYIKNKDTKNDMETCPRCYRYKVTQECQRGYETRYSACFRWWARRN